MLYHMMGLQVTLLKGSFCNSKIFAQFTVYLHGTMDRDKNIFKIRKSTYLKLLRGIQYWIGVEL